LREVRRVCVFCGSSAGASPAYLKAAERLGRLLAAEGLELVYGGASVGLMGRVADVVLGTGGRVFGVIPRALAVKEIAHSGLSELRIVESMHERKAAMVELADGFIALPGGLGTLEELFEVLTWAQLGLHRKPCALLDVDGYYQPLAAFLDHAVEHGFVKPEHRAMLLVDDNPARLLERMRAYVPPQLPKWILEAET
jgi:uncharacterized protein (TIGR00730 family)